MYGRTTSNKLTRPIYIIHKAVGRLFTVLVQVQMLLTDVCRTY